MPRIRSLRDLRLVLVLATLAFASPARAALLPFQATLDIAFGGFFFVTLPGAGVATVNGDGTGGALTQLGLPAGVFTIATGFPGTFPLGGIDITAANGAGSVGPLATNAGGGAMPVQGVARLCLLAPCSVASFVLSLPLSGVGAGGVATVTGPFSVTLEGAPWTKGRITVSRPASVSIVSGFARGPNGLAGSTAQPGGVVSLVTPIRIATTLPGFEDLDSWAQLHIELVPEPATLVLVAVGLAAIAGAARRRRG
jgi:hypothetical protein